MAGSFLGIDFLRKFRITVAPETSQVLFACIATAPGVMATPAAAHPGGPAAILFSDRLLSSPLQQEQPRICPGTVFLLPCREVFASSGPAAPLQPAQSGICTASRTRLRGLTSDLIRSSPEASAWGGGSPVEAAYVPGSWLDLAWRQYFVLQHHCTLCTVPVYRPQCMQ